MTGGTANDRMKAKFNEWLWGSVAVAAALHGALFAFWPAMGAADYGFETNELEAIVLPPEVRIPPPPRAITRPATPVVGDARIDEDITIAVTTFEANPVNNLPPPPTSSAQSEDITRAPMFTPYTVSPQVLNREEIVRMLERTYPPMLRDAGIGGDVNVWFLLDVDGRVMKTQVAEPSGYELLDAAALKVAEIMKFSPAMNRDKRVQVWVSLPIHFMTSR
jgi:protein TonB